MSRMASGFRFQRRLWRRRVARQPTNTIIGEVLDGPEDKLALDNVFIPVPAALPLLLSALAIGLLVGMIQAATQIQEMTLTFIPKLIVMALALIIAGSWMLGLLTEYTINLFENIPDLIG